MSQPINYSSSTPAAPAGAVLLKWLADAAIQNSSTPRNISVYLDTVIESLFQFTDILTANVSITKHGLTPKLPNDATKFLDGTGAWSTPAGGGSSSSIAAGARKHFAVSANGSADISSASTTGLGDQIVGIGATFTGGEPPQNSPNRSNATSKWASSTPDTPVGWAGGGSWKLGRNIDSLFLVYLGRATDMKAWVGFFNNFLSALTNSDTAPTTEFAAFRFSTNAGDSNFQAVTRHSGTNTVVDTGIAADTAMHRFGIKFTDGGSPSIKFYIDGTLVATITTNLPSTSATMGWAAQGSYHTTDPGALIGLGQVTIEGDL